MHWSALWKTLPFPQIDEKRIGWVSNPASAISSG